MTHPPRTPRNNDGSFKTIDQLMRSIMTVLQYGRFIAQQDGKPQNTIGRCYKDNPVVITWPARWEPPLQHVGAEEG